MEETKKNLDEILRDIEKSVKQTEKELIKNIEDKLAGEKTKLELSVYTGVRRNGEEVKPFFSVGEYKELPEKFSDIENDKIMCSVYIDEKYSKILKLIEKKDEVYRGYMEDEENKRYSFEFFLKQNSQGKEKEEELQKFLFENNVEVAPIYNPHTRKMFDIIFLRLAENEISGINEVAGYIEKIDFGILERDYKLERELVPIWNIEMRKNERIQFSVVPIKERKLFCIETIEEKNYLKLYKSNEKDVYIDHIVKNEDEEGREKYKIYFNQDVKEWDYCKIYDIENQDIERLKLYKSTLNRHNGKIGVKTKFEIERIIRENCDKLQLEYQGYLTEKNYNLLEIQSYIDIFMYPNNSKRDVFDFFNTRKKIYIKIEKKDESLFEDKVNFLLTYMTFIYPEINWKGVYNG